MQIALICEKCGKIYTEESEGAVLVVDFRLKQMSFICLNKGCKHESILDMRAWKDKSKEQLPPTRIC